MTKRACSCAFKAACFSGEYPSREDGEFGMKKLTSLGVDLSTTATGVVLLEENGKTPKVLLDTEVKIDERGHRAQRRAWWPRSCR